MASFINGEWRMERGEWREEIIMQNAEIGKGKELRG